MYLYRAIDDRGHTIEFLLSSTRDRPAAMRFLRQTLARRGRPHRIGFDRSQTNRQAIRACNAESRLQDRSGAPQSTIKIRSSQYLNNRIEQDHRGYQTARSAHARIQVDLNRSGYHLGIELIHMMRKNQAHYVSAINPSLAAQFELLAA